MYFFLHGYVREGVMSELQQPPGVQEVASRRTKTNMLEQMMEQDDRTERWTNTWETSGFSVR